MKSVVLSAFLVLAVSCPAAEPPYPSEKRRGKKDPMSEAQDE